MARNTISPLVAHRNACRAASDVADAALAHWVSKAAEARAVLADELAELAHVEREAEVPAAEEGDYLADLLGNMVEETPVVLEQRALVASARRHVADMDELVEDATVDAGVALRVLRHAQEQIRLDRASRYKRLVGNY